MGGSRITPSTQTIQTKNIKYVFWKNVIITFAALSMQADKHKKEKYVNQLIKS